MLSFELAVIVRTLIMGVATYISLILLLRISGLRTLSKMNAFDFVITVALGSTFASVLMNKNISLLHALTALTLLISLQFIVTWLSVRAPWVRKIVTGEPKLLMYNGQHQSDNMRKARVTPDEIRAAIRLSGGSGSSETQTVVLETNGSLSVLNQLHKPQQEFIQSLNKEAMIKP